MLLYLIITSFIITRLIYHLIRKSPIYTVSYLENRLNFSKYESSNDIPLVNYTYYCNIWKSKTKKTLLLLDELSQDSRFKDIKCHVKYGFKNKLYLAGSPNDLIHVVHDNLTKNFCVDDLKVPEFYYTGIFNLVQPGEPELFVRGETLDKYQDNTEMSNEEKVELTKDRISKILSINYKTTYKYRPTYYSIRFMTTKRDILEVKFEDDVKFNYLGNLYDKKPNYYIMKKLIKLIKLELDK